MKQLQKLATIGLLSVGGLLCSSFPQPQEEQTYEPKQHSIILQYDDAKQKVCDNNYFSIQDDTTYDALELLAMVEAQYDYAVSLAHFYEDKYNLPHNWLVAMYGVESGLMQFDPTSPITVESYVGAGSLAQIMPGTLKHLRNVAKKKFRYVYEPSLRGMEDAFEAGSFYVNNLFDRFGGICEEYVLTGYNWGPGRTRQMIRRYKNDYTAAQAFYHAPFLRRVNRETPAYVYAFYKYWAMDDEHRKAHIIRNRHRQFVKGKELIDIPKYLLDAANQGDITCAQYEQEVFALYKAYELQFPL